MVLKTLKYWPGDAILPSPLYCLPVDSGQSTVDHTGRNVTFQLQRCIVRTLRPGSGDTGADTGDSYGHHWRMFAILTPDNGSHGITGAAPTST